MSKYLILTKLRWLYLGFAVLILDLISKQWIIAHFLLNESITLIPSLNITYVQNPGAAFSFLANKNGWQRWLFIFISVVILLILIVAMYRSNNKQYMINYAYTLIISGALGNLFDRIIYGVVIDFIDFYINYWHWPIFNLADTSICIGMILIILDGFRTYTK
ncbi:signal peptidase II [Candidatus Fukatsuia anoeciicola]|uniref:signal peptidase II n=1 Tax=Candidatus Fukatsuia anoeciicola TaxID=2994492 RepID=UPI003464763C